GAGHPVLKKKQKSVKAVIEMRQNHGISIQRLSRAFKEPRSSVARWVSASPQKESRSNRPCPVSGEASLRQRIQELCDEPRHRTFGHRRIRALLKKRFELVVNRKTVLKVMRELKLTRPKMWHRPWRPKRIEKVHATQLNEHWEIDMTSFQLSSLMPLFLVVVIDCCSREIVGYTLDHRCRAKEWVAALRQALEARGLTSKAAAQSLKVRSDNGAQPCSKAFVEYLGASGATGEYTGYNAPDDKGYASYCTSIVGFDATSGKRRRLASLLPCLFTGGSPPGCSYRHSSLSL
ncbi:MAG: DDE-type integrase/transposase/recombinase, partial [Gammaproteobacteria bacterium]|nr:DDE-type integrase/transposase/recombinase [Gammaproteobacteria bacterium]